MSFFEDLMDPEAARQHIRQGSDEWDQMRVGRFTSSEMWRLLTPPKSNKSKEDGLLSETAMTYIQEKVAETITGKLKQSSYAYPLVYGKDLEPEAIEKFCELGYQWDEIGFVAFGDHAGGSPDGIINETDILEAKCPYAIDTQIGYLQLTDQWDLKRHNPKYYWQVMSNLLFTKKERGHFVSYDPRYPEKYRIVHIEVKPENEAFDKITEVIPKAVKEKLELIQLLTS